MDEGGRRAHIWNSHYPYPLLMSMVSRISDVQENGGYFSADSDK